MTTKLNVLLIQVDQWPAFALSLLGYPNVNTPNLDRLVESGEAVLFERAVCQSPICLPSRISMLSGQYPSTTKQFGFTGLNPRTMPWLPSHLRHQGVSTGAFGKFHLGSVGMNEFGFEFAASTLPEDEDFAIPKGNHYRNYCEKHHLSWPTDQMHGHDWRGKQAQRSKAAEPLKEKHHLIQTSCVSDVPLEHSLERWTSNCALDFIRKKATDQENFFVWLSFDRPHHPQTVPQEWWSYRQPKELVLERLLSEEELNLHGTTMRKLLSTDSFRSFLGEDGFRYLLASYFALIQGIDGEIGRIIDTLEQLGINQQTTIIFVADHGDEAGHHGLYMKGRDVCSTAITHVPLIVRPAAELCPNGPRRNRRPEPVELVDLPGTICSFLGCSPQGGIEGCDLSAAVLNDCDLPVDRAVFCEDIEGRTIIHKNWMLSFYEHDSDYCQLYNLTDDPGQYRNLYHDTTVQEKRIDLKRRLIAFLSERQYGTYCEEDVLTMKRRLDPDDPLIPIHTSYSTPFGFSVDQCRCALFLHCGKEKFFVPYYEDEDILYFCDNSTCNEERMKKFTYATRNTAVKCSPGKIENRLDDVLCQLIGQSHTVSVLKRHLQPSHNG